MAVKFSAEERERILAESFELLRRDDRPAESFEPELSREQILQAALLRPIESTNDRHRREIAESEARRVAQRDHNELRERAAMAKLEAQLIERIASQDAAQRQVSLEIVSEALEVFDEEICAPLARQLTELQAVVDKLRSELKQQRRGEVEPIDLPVLELPRRMQ